MRPIFFIILLMLLPVLMPLKAQELRQFSFGDIYKKSIRFDFQNVQNFIILDVKLEDVLPAKFIFDTGSEYTIIIKKELAYILNMDYFRSIPLYGSDLSTKVYAFISRNATMNIDEKLMVQSNVLVLESDFLHLDEMLGLQIDGILGANVFNRYVLHINNRKNYIEFIKKEHFTPRKNYVELPIEVDKGKPYIISDVSMEGEQAKALKFLIDSGSAIPMLLYNNTSEYIEMPENVIPGNLGMGLGGMLEGYLGKIHELNLGPFDFTNLVTSFQEFEVDSLNQLYLNRNGLIGNALLSRFDVYIDYPEEKLYLKPNKHYDERFRVDRSGLILIATGPNFNNVLVQKVIEGSPAEEAGIKAGDVIHRFKFWPVYFYDLNSITYKLSGKEGKKIRMVLKRNGEKIKTSFRLRSLFEDSPAKSK